MLFSSGAFLLYFLPLALLGYQLLGRYGRRAVILWLTFMSLVFYAYWNAKMTWFLLASMLANFLFSQAIAGAQTEAKKKTWLFAGIALNLGALCYFKYLFPFLTGLSSLGIPTGIWQHPILPLGISFFTFTQIAYLIDLSEGEASRQDLAKYGLFVTFFPHLIAGPILHHREIMPQFERKIFRLSSEDLFIGLSWFVMGLAKKVIFADRLGSLADPIFRQAGSVGILQSWVGVLCYSMQLYLDFSGYSDMAIGLARMFSIRFPINFNSPYKAGSVIEFWSRWHMTLTRYLTLYLYNPISLAINRRRLQSGKKVSPKAQRTPGGFAVMVAFPLLVTMFLAGVWHGAGLQFVIFGLLHGFYLTVNHGWRLYRGGKAAAMERSLWNRAGGVLLTYLCVLVGQVFFRAESTADALHLLAAMVGLHHGAPIYHLPGLAIILVAWYPIVWFFPNTQEIIGESSSALFDIPIWRRIRYAPTWSWAVSMAVLFLAAILFVANSATFLYFQF